MPTRLIQRYGLRCAVLVMVAGWFLMPAPGCAAFRNLTPEQQEEAVQSATTTAATVGAFLPPPWNFIVPGVVGVAGGAWLSKRKRTTETAK